MLRFIVFVFTYLIMLNSANAYNDVVKMADDQYMYIGGECGLVLPVIDKFRHKKSGATIKLKRSKMYTGQVGYSFYPQMSVEFSFTHQPEYRVNYRLPEIKMGLITIPETSDNTKLSNNVYMLSLVYNLKDFDNGLSPFVIVGGGLTTASIKATSVKFHGKEIFKINKSNTNYPSWQIGGGLEYQLARNFSINASAKLQVVHNIKIKYDQFSTEQQAFVTASPIKKSIAVGEFGLGFTYKLPI